MRYEKDLQDYIYNKIKPVIKPPYGINTEVPVPYKHIYIPENDSVRLEIKCFKQDIAIYKSLFKNNVSVEGFNFKIGKKYKDWGLPFVIIEIKNKPPITHEILAYSQKAKMIKSIFPYCQYLFLINEKSAKRLFCLGETFDDIILLKNVNNDKEMGLLKKRIRACIKKAESILKKMQSTLDDNYIF